MYILEGICAKKIFYLNPCGPSFIEAGGRPTTPFKANVGDLGPRVKPVLHQNELVIFYEITSQRDSHKERAEALQRENVNSQAVHLKADMAPAEYKGLTTAAFWGHGSSRTLCNYNPKKLAAFVLGLKKKNAGLKTIEIITCDARHTERKEQSYVDVLLPLLDGAVEVKALPIGQHGKTGAWSRLLANVHTKSWAYVTGPTEKVMLLARRTVLKQMPSDPEPVNGVPAPTDLATHANYWIRMADPIREWTVTYGYFNELRRVLSVVKPKE